MRSGCDRSSRESNEEVREVIYCGLPATTLPGLLAAEATTRDLLSHRLSDGCEGTAAAVDWLPGTGEQQMKALAAPGLYSHRYRIEADVQ